MDKIKLRLKKALLCILYEVICTFESEFTVRNTYINTA